MWKVRVCVVAIAGVCALATGGPAWADGGNGGEIWLGHLGQGGDPGQRTDPDTACTDGSDQSSSGESDHIASDYSGNEDNQNETSALNCQPNPAGGSGSDGDSGCGGSHAGSGSGPGSSESGSGTRSSGSGSQTGERGPTSPPSTVPVSASVSGAGAATTVVAKAAVGSAVHTARHKHKNKLVRPARRRHVRRRHVKPRRVTTPRFTG